MGGAYLRIKQYYQLFYCAAKSGWHGIRHPAEMGASEVEAFLSQERNLAFVPAVSMTAGSNRSSKNWSISSFDAIYEHYFGRVGRPHRLQFTASQTR
jgi:hypothetical protein